MTISPEKIFHLSDRRLSAVLDRAAEHHREGELLLCLTSLDKASDLLSAERREARRFLLAWKNAVERESRGLSLPAAPSSWGAVAREISERARQGESFDESLKASLDAGASKRRLFLRAGWGLLGAAAFFVGFTAIAFVLRGALTQFDQSYRLAQAPFFRRGVWLGVHAFATLAWGGALAYYGFRWIRDCFEPRLSLAPKFRLKRVESEDSGATR